MSIQNNISTPQSLLEGIEGLTIDSKNFVYAGGVKICRFDPQQQTLLFFDKDRRRSQKRGSREVSVPINCFVNLDKYHHLD